MASMELVICARNSPLSLAQVEEIRNQMAGLATFRVIALPTKGDIDLTTSLRGMEKSNFFTEELDQMLLNEEADIAIHSAKDLPCPLPKGLQIIALTEGVDPSDSLVLREGESLKKGAVIATSSERREAAVRALEPDVRFIDLRGPIHTRLSLLDTRQADGVVVAEAALIRLKLTHLNRIRLPGETAEGQGQLAIVAKKSFGNLFNHLDIRCLSYTQG